MKAFARLCAVILALAALSGCVQPAPNTRPWLLESTPSAMPAALAESDAVVTPVVLPTEHPAGYVYPTPTPDAPRDLPQLRSNSEQYVVQAGDYLTLIAQHYNLDVNTLLLANPNINPNWLEIGQVLTIPAPAPSASPSSFKIIPDSELVYGPMSTTIDLDSFISKKGGYLSRYSGEANGHTLSGAEIVQLVSAEYSVNPRLLLALLEWRSGWVTQDNPAQTYRDYPMGYIEASHKNLYRQLSWTANQLNHGYYAWKNYAISYILCTDGSLVMLAPTVNAGTVGVQYLLSTLLNLADWQQAVSDNGVFSVYSSLFINPFDLAIEPLVPANLQQPQLQLPFEAGVSWSFTGGPHAGWGDGSAWAAIDFAPPGTAYGCFTSNEWVTAAADGLIIRSKDGEVVQDLNGDGLEATGWTLLYMHIESRDRVSAGTYVKAGDRIGHASCEGGVSNGTHVHIARRYNGEWIPAYGSLPFVLSGWQAALTGSEYEGTLTSSYDTVYSWDGRTDDNQIAR
jgi:murein DD-endopeptidase MepM/ murein hydrolase activator NlpD